MLSSGLSFLLHMERKRYFCFYIFKTIIKTNLINCLERPLHFRLHVGVYDCLSMGHCKTHCLLFHKTVISCTIGGGLQTAYFKYNFFTLLNFGLKSYLRNCIKERVKVARISFLHSHSRKDRLCQGPLCEAVLAEEREMEGHGESSSAWGS